MYFNGKDMSELLSRHQIKHLKELEAACEASIKDDDGNTFILRDKYFKYIESFLPKSEHILFKHIAKYEDKFSDILSSPYLTKLLPFSEQGDDANVVFKCTKIDQNELKADIKKLPKPKGMDSNFEIAAFQPLQVVLFLIMRYYLVTKQMDRYKCICYYYGYSIYWKRWNTQFGKRGISVDPNVMMYTINNLTYRVLLKKLGSLKELLGYIISGRLETYRERIAQCSDDDIRYVIQQFSSDLGSKIVEIANKYYDNKKKGNTFLEEKSFIQTEEGELQKEDSSLTATVEELAQKYTNDFFMSDINTKRVKYAAVIAKDVSQKELHATLEYISNEVHSNNLHSFYSSLFYLYLTQGENADKSKVKSMTFLKQMIGVIKKGNSNNVNIVKIRGYVDQWLTQGSRTFANSSREATKVAYRKAVYYYFILCVCFR